jgi:uncharacterized membrane protein YhaH (DUF805 family)
MKGYMNAMRRYFEFSGRSSRSEFWFFVLFMLIVLVIASIIDQFVLGSEGPGILYFILAIVHLIPAIAVSVRRLHDIDRTGLWVLLFWLAPLVVFLIAMIFMGSSLFMVMSGDSGAMAAAFATMGAGFLLVAVVDIVIVIIAIVFYVTPGIPGPNTYGPPPP